MVTRKVITLKKKTIPNNYALFNATLIKRKLISLGYSSTPLVYPLDEGGLLLEYPDEGILIKVKNCQEICFLHNDKKFSTDNVDSFIHSLKICEEY